MWNYVGIVILNVALSVATTVVFNRVNQEKIVQVNLPKIMSAHIKEQGKKGLNEAQMNAEAKSYAEALDKAVSEISKKDRVLILVGPAVVSDVPDYTDNLMKLLEKEASHSD